MTYSVLLAAVASTPTTVDWSPKVAIVMIVCNIIAIAFGKYTIKYQNTGPSLPSPALFGGMSIPALLATTSFGHILGVGAILGLANAGAF
ncbi:MAG: photosystem I reaction center subunit PsaK [Xenococcaceae cyanobacterium]